jgi:putative isomerase
VKTDLAPIHAIAPARRWNSWRSGKPAEMFHLPTGIAVTPCAYAASVNAFTDFSATEGKTRLGPRAIDGTRISCALTHAGTALDWSWHQPEEDVVLGAWRTTGNGEWGLRFWVMPVLSVANRDDIYWRFDPESGIFSAKVGESHAAFLGERPPLLASFHESMAALAAEYREFGYFYLGSRGISGRIAAPRYNLDEMPLFRFAIAIAGSERDAVAKASAALAASAPADVPPIHTGINAGALDALRDIIGWNSVFDFINQWPYTSLSRNWVEQKFGGFGLWLNDIFYHALASSLLDGDIARENIKAVLATETPEGNLPCLITGRDQWIDRSQTPIPSYLLWKLWKHTGDDALVEFAFPRLLRSHDWWFTHRDGAGRGLMSWGTSPVGSGLYRSTKLGAKNESSMDNSPVHDETLFDEKSGCLDSFDVGLNSLIVLDGEILADWALMRGDKELAERLLKRADALRARIATQLWDPAREIFANRRWSGVFVKSLAPTSFYPLLANAADEAQSELLEKSLNDPKRFGGAFRLPSVAREDPAYWDNVYWRGRVWPPLNYLTYQGLKRAGAEAMASRLAEDSLALFRAAWAKRQCPENFSAETGLADDQPDTDLFYGWGVLMPLIAINEIIDVTPWNGWEITHPAGDFRLGPLQAMGGRMLLESVAGEMSIVLNGEVVLRTDISGRFRHFEISSKRIAFEPPVSGGQVRLALLPPGRISQIRYGSDALSPVADGAGSRIALPAGSTLRLCVIDIAP